MTDPIAPLQDDFGGRQSHFTVTLLARIHRTELQRAEYAIKTDQADKFSQACPPKEGSRRQ